MQKRRSQNDKADNSVTDHGLSADQRETKLVVMIELGLMISVGAVALTGVVRPSVTHATFVLLIVACFVCAPGRTRAALLVTIPSALTWLALTVWRDVPPIGTVLAQASVLAAAVVVGRTVSMRADAASESESLRIETERAISDRLSIEIAWRQRMEENLTRRANIDDLTSLASRRHFHELVDIEIGRAQRTSEPLCVLLLDIDHFKLVNDAHGHRAGDQVLTELSGLLAKLVRRIDVVGRLGGEEFGVLMPGVGVERALIAAHRIRAEIAEMAISLDGAVISPTVSIGVTEFEAWTESFEDALGRADEALYEAKDAGRDRVHVRLAQPPDPVAGSSPQSLAG